MSDEGMRVTGVRARAVEVPMNRPLHTGGGAVSAAPLVLLDLETDGGVTGCAYVFCYTPLALGAVVELAARAGEALRGEPAAPDHLRGRLAQRFRLIGAQGITGLVASAIDMAAWDALGKRVRCPLAELLGAGNVPVRAYNSNGLGLRDDLPALLEDAKALTDGGFGAIKLRLGYRSGAHDARIADAVRGAVDATVDLMSDYNQCLTAIEAERRVRILAGSGLYWVEEPVRADDYEGAARVRAASDLPIQLGENAWGPEDVHKSLMAGASDYYMPDAGKVGGVSGWRDAAAQAAAHGLPVSSHLYPEVSVHLLAATPTRHWLEYVDWASPILDEPLRIEDGTVRVPARPGLGIGWNEDAVARFAA